jgi:hypothetical protein
MPLIVNMALNIGEKKSVFFGEITIFFLLV